jgi:hypothetical protein
MAAATLLHSRAAAEEVRQLVLRAGTPVPLATVAELNSKTVRQGDRFALQVREDVLVDGRVAIPRLARAEGEITRHSAKGPFGKGGKLGVRLLHVYIGGRPVRLDGQRTSSGKSGLAPALMTSVVAGAFGALVSGKNATVPAGTPITGYIHRDVPLTLPSARSGPIVTPDLIRGPPSSAKKGGCRIKSGMTM